MHAWKVGDGSLGIFATPSSVHRGKKEVVHLGDNPYLLAYHACPDEQHTQWEVNDGPTGSPVADYYADFLPASSSQPPSPHPLHRQTGLSHLLVISAFDSEPTFDLSTNKLLLSSVSVALHNAGCTLPAFVPSGPARRGLYTGIMLTDTNANFGDLEIKFRSFHDPRGAAKFASLGDMLAIADQRLQLESDADIAAAKDSTTVAASFSYRIAVAPTPAPSRGSSRSLPPLPMGNLAGTTLRHLQLDTYFPSLHPEDVEDPDPSAAPLWLLSRDWRPGPPQLTELLEHLSSEWTSAKKREDSGAGGRGLIGSLINDTSSGGGPAIVDAADVHSAVLSLFSWDAYESRGSRWSASAAHNSTGAKQTPKPTALANTSVDQLVPRLSPSSSVPLDSFLWHLAHRLLDCASPSTSLSYRHTSVSSFLKGVWMEVMSSLERCWDQGAYIPGVNWAGDNTDLALPGPTVDLRRALLHQKLSMLNCCIRLKNKRERSVGEKEEMDDGRRRSTELVHEVDPASPAPGGWNVRRDTEDEEEEEEEEPEEKPTVWRSGFRLRERGRKLGEGLGKLFERKPKEDQGEELEGAWGDLLNKVGENTKAPVVARTNTGDGWSVEDEEELPFDEEEEEEEEESQHTGDVFYETMEDVPGSVARPGKKRGTPRRRMTGESVEPTSPLSSSVSDSAQRDLMYGASFRSDSFVDVDHHLASRPTAKAPVSASLMVDDDQEDHVEGELLDDEEQAGGSHVWLDSSGNPIKLVDGSGDCWIPEVQEAGHMTEDMVRDLEDRLEKLGDGYEAAKARAELQTAQLKSDMEAFKAANPRASLEDFVRWHSPRDCIETTDEEGKVIAVKLSSRMQEPGNLWLDLWKKAKRIPAARQKPLFDYESEARRVLSDLRKLTPFDILTQLLPTVFLIVYDTMATHESARSIPAISKAADTLAKIIVSMPWDELRWGDFEEVSDRIHKAMSGAKDLEELVSRANDLLAQLPLQYGLVERLLSANETVVQDGAEREAAWELFSEGDLLTNPTGREYIVRMVAPSEPYVAASLQRFYFALKDGEVRVMERLSRPGNF